MNPILSILHISDFHFTRRKIRDQQIVVDALTQDLGSLCIGHRRPDVIVFTGDLVQAGGEDSHDEAYDLLLSRVAEATGCSDDRIFICPGNHDLSRTLVSKAEKEHRAWRENSSDMVALNDAYVSGQYDILLQEKFAKFNDLQRYLSDGSLVYRNAFVSVYKIESMNIEIVIVNTASFSTGGLSKFERDERLLAVPEHAVLDAVRCLTPGSFRIFATHHPLEILSEASARCLSAVVGANGGVHLFGHMHDPKAQSAVGFRGKLFSSQCGAVFTQRQKAHIGYTLLSVERDNLHYETHLRTYFDDRKAFDEAVDIVSGGIFYSSQNARSFWRSIAKPVDESVFRRHLSTFCLQSLLAGGASHTYDKEVHDRFVPPPMKKAFVQKQSGDEHKGDDETSVSFEDLLSGDDNVILYASPEYGRTTVLRMLSFRYLSDANSLHFSRIPIIVDFEDIKSNSANLLRVVRSRAPEPPDGIDVDSLLKLGHACLMFDDVVFGDTKRMSILREFVSNFPKPRYILSSSKNSAAQYSSRVNPEMPIHFEFIELCVLRRRDMRQLVIKFSGNSNVDTLLDRLQTEFKEINLPFTAANGGIFMSIHEAQSGFRPINRSVLIEQFIDTMLTKAAAEQSRRETFDYANKTALLAYVAAWMAETNEYVPTIESVREKMKSYIDRLGLIVSVDKIVDEFFTARIFAKRPESRLSFRYRAILEYFIALQMSSSPEFYKWVTDEDRYLQFVNEIQYYSGKLRNDAKLVETIANRFALIIEELQKSKGPLDVAQLSNLSLPAKDADITADMLAKQLAAPMSEVERDEELEAEIPVDAEGRQEVFRPSIVDPGQKLIASLILYSGVLKNMEMIDDASKRRHLSQVWRGWSIFLLLSLTVVPEIARLRRFRVNGVLYELNAPIGMSDGELTRIISLNLPVGISRLISGALGTEKLEKQLICPGLDTVAQPKIFEWFCAALIADLKLASTPSALADAMDSMRSSSYLREALVWKIAELRRLDRISEPHLNRVLPVLARAIADLRGGSEKERVKEKGKQMQRLAKEGVLLKIKRQKEAE